MGKFALLGLLALCLSACGKSAVECTAASAQSPVVDIVKEQLEKATSARVRGGDTSGPISLSKIRAAISQLVITIEDIRTSKEDPNSTKRFCTGTLKIRFPADTLSDADKAREAGGTGSVSDLADSDGVERHADSFTADLDFNIQPTDDGSKVFAETESGNNMFGFAAEVLASGLLRSAIEESQRAQQNAQEQQKASAEQALDAQRTANLNAAKTDNQLALQTIGATWKALPAAVRSQMLPAQRAWIAKKDADCRVEEASASVNPTEMETARLTCDTRVTQERVSLLQQYRSDGASSTPSDGATPTDND